MDKETDKLLFTLENLSIGEKQVLSLHLIQKLDIATTSFVMGVDKEKVETDVDNILKYLYLPVGVYFRDEEAIRESEESFLANIFEFLNEEEEMDRASEEDKNENYEYYLDKFGEKRNQRLSQNKREKPRLDFNDDVRNVIKNWWYWELYVPESLKEEDLLSYRSRINDLIEELREKTFLRETIQDVVDVLFETLGDLPYYYAKNYTIIQITSLLKISRDEVVAKFEKMRSRVKYFLGDKYKLENVVYVENDDYLPNDERLKNIIKVKICELEQTPVPESLLDEILMAYRKSKMRKQSN